MRKVRGRTWLVALPWAALVVVLAAGTVGAVTVNTPNGGEKIASGSIYDIQWSGLKDEAYYAIRYSLDGGSTWRTVASNVQGRLYPWAVPRLPVTKMKCLVMVLAFDNGGRRLRLDRSDQPFVVASMRRSDYLPPPLSVNLGHTFQEPAILEETDPDNKGDGTTYTDNHSGLECDNSILIETGSHEFAGSSAAEIQFKVGDDFTIHLAAPAGGFQANAALLYELPISCEECYKTIPADDWDRLSLVTNSGDGLQVRRVVLVKSCETVLDVTLNAWLDRYYQKVLDFSINTAQDKWDDVGGTRSTVIYYAAQDLGQTGAKKYVNEDVWWCSEFASYMFRKAGLSTPSGSIGTAHLLEWFQDHHRYFTRDDVENGTYTVKAGDYMSVNGGNHSVIFRGWVSDTPGSAGFDNDSEYTTIEGNNGNAVRTGTRTWRRVDWVGRTW